IGASAAADARPLGRHMLHLRPPSADDMSHLGQWRRPVVTFDLARTRRPKTSPARLTWGLSLAAALTLGHPAHGQSPTPQGPEVWSKLAIDQELATALYGGVDPAATALGNRTARIPMFRMLPGFLSDPG